MAGHQHRLRRRLLEPDATYRVVAPVPLVERHLTHGREHLTHRPDSDLRGLLRREHLDQQVEERRPADLTDPQMPDVRDDVVPDEVAVPLPSPRTHRVVRQEPLRAELRHRHASLVSRPRLVQEPASVMLLIRGHLVGPLTRVVRPRGLVLPVRRPVHPDEPRPASPGPLDHVSHVAPPAPETGNVLDEMLEAPTDT